jgi:hemoglobin
MKPDITTRTDVELLVNTFYEKVNDNRTLSPIFNEVAKVDWPHHLPKMYSFWSSLLLGEQSYTGNPMVKHIDLSRQTDMTEVQFSTWLLLFNETVNELFVGEKAEEAKSRAANIARLMQHKIHTS